MVTQDIAVGSIAVGKRARSLNSERVRALRDSIEQLGLLQPIVVSGTGQLVAGYHRLEAARQLGWLTIQAHVLEADDLEAELAEIDENLIRHELTVLEQSEHLLRRDEILTAMGMRAARGDNRYTDRGETVSPLKTSADIANEIGLGERAAQGRIQIARSIVPDVKDKIADTELADRTRDLLALARLEPEQQRKVIEFDGVASGETRVAEAVRQMSTGGATAYNNHAISDTPGYDGDEWYTPPEYIEAARRVMGGIDLDPASCDSAQEVVKAGVFYTKQDDGLAREWHGAVWLNPPYSMPLIKQFVQKAIDEYEAGSVSSAIVLTNNSSDTSWFHALLSRYPACFTRGRVQFWRPSHDDFGTRQGQVFFYLGEDGDKFASVFSQFGVVVTQYKEGDKRDY